MNAIVVWQTGTFRLHTVLLVGENELLQQTRAAVLRMMGADVICSSPDSALVVQEDRNCDLVVLCHSLREPFSASLAETIRSRWPNTRILQVTSSRIGEAAEAVPAVDAISSADPERLIMRAVALLRRRQSRSIQPPDRTSGRLSA
jgi:DNA-binding response OmpR family regulator